MKIFLAILIMFIGYGVAIFLIVRTFVVAFTMRKSVPFVPSSKKLVRKSAELLEIKAGDTLVDLGSGDGRFPIYAAGLYPEANFVGIELSKGLATWSRFWAWLKRRKNVQFINADIFTQDFSRFDKVFMYMTRPFANRLMYKLEKELKPGSIVVSLVFGMGDDFEKDHKVKEYRVGGGLRKQLISVWRKV